MRCDIHGIEYFVLGSCPACDAAEQRERTEERRHDEALRAQREAGERQARLLEEAAWEQQRNRELDEGRLREEREHRRQDEQRQFLRAGLPEFSTFFQTRWQQLNADRQSLIQEKQKIDETAAYAIGLRTRAASLQKKLWADCRSALESLLLTGSPIPGEDVTLQSHSLGPSLLQTFATAATTSYARSKMDSRNDLPSDLRSLLIGAERLRAALAKSEPLAIAGVVISQKLQAEFLSASARFAAAFAEYSNSSIDPERTRGLTAAMNTAGFSTMQRDLVSWVIALAIYNTKERLLESYIRATSPPELTASANLGRTADKTEAQAEASLLNFTPRADRLELQYQFAFRQLYSVGRDVVTGIRPPGRLIQGFDCPSCRGLVTSAVASCPYCGAQLTEVAARDNTDG